MLKLNNQFFLFVIAGGLAAVANIGSRIIINFWLDFRISVILAYCIGMLVAYILSRMFVFTENKTSVLSSSIKFVLVNVIAIIQTYYISVYLNIFLKNYTELQFTEEIAHAVGIIVPVISSFIGHKYFSFR